MGRTFIFVIAASYLAFCTGVASAAAPATCAPYNKPITLKFDTQAPRPIYNNNLNIAGIRNLFRTRGLAVGGPHERALGVTYVQTVLSLGGDSVLIPNRGGYCVHLKSIDAKFGWSRMEVFVASDYRPDTCEYRAVLDHENQHVAINREALQTYAPRLRAELEKILGDQQPVYSQNPEGAADAVLKEIRRRMDAVVDQFQTTMATRNAVIDTSHNYGATAALCPSWNVDKKKG